MSQMVQSDQASKNYSIDLGNYLNADFAMGKNGYHYAILYEKANPYAVKINSRQFKSHLVVAFAKNGKTLKSRELADHIDLSKANAEMSGRRYDFLSRVAPFQDGIVIDSGNSENTHFSVSKDGVALVYQNSTCIFAPDHQSTELPMPVLEGKDNLFKLRQYLNVCTTDKILLIAWLSYVLAHPKVETSKYPFLVLFGSQGYGKSFLSNLLLKLIDPSNYGLRVMPNTPKDLAIMTNGSHVIAFDNIRYLTNTMSDALCMASTGSNYTGRQLFTDADTNVIRLHAAIILNGIHPFITQPDLAQRCIHINLLSIDQTNRKSDKELMTQLEQDMPYIFGGLLEYIAAVFAALPDAKVVNPERMIEFSRWLAAMEIVDQVPSEAYQSLYSSVVQEGQLDVVQSNSLGDAMYAFGMKQELRPWTGTATQLLIELNSEVKPGTLRSPDWPKCPISLSKKLAGIKAPLEALGISIGFTRGKVRKYTVSLKEGVSELY